MCKPDPNFLAGAQVTVQGLVPFIGSPPTEIVQCTDFKTLDPTTEELFTCICIKNVNYKEACTLVLSFVSMMTRNK